MGCRRGPAPIHQASTPTPDRPALAWAELSVSFVRTTDSGHGARRRGRCRHAPARQAGRGDPRQRPAGKQLHRFTGQGHAPFGTAWWASRLLPQVTHVTLGGRGSPPGPGPAASALRHHRRGIWRAIELALVVKSSFHRTGFFQLLRQLRRAYLLRLRAGRHLGGWHPASRSTGWSIARSAAPSPSPSAPATRPVYRRPDAIVIQRAQCAPLVRWRSGSVSCTSWPPWRSSGCRDSDPPAYSLRGCGHQTGRWCGRLCCSQRCSVASSMTRHPGPFGKMRHLSGPGAGGAGGGIVLPLLLVRASVWLASVQPISDHCAGAWTGLARRLDQRLGADDAAGASGAVDDNRRLCGEGRQCSPPAGPARRRARWMLPGMLMVWYSSRRASTITTSCRPVDERLNLPGAERRCVTHAFPPARQRLTGGVDVLKQLAAAALSASETLGRRAHILIAPGPQPPSTAISPPDPRRCRRR